MSIKRLLPDDDGHFESQVSFDKDGMPKMSTTFTGKNVNRDRVIGPHGPGGDYDEDDDDNEVSRLMTIASKYEMDDLPRDDPSFGTPGGNSSTYYPRATHGPVKHERAQYHHLTQGGLMDNNRD